jgi:hypothetical protein
VALDVCEDCRRARQSANGELVDVSSAVAAMAECDAQHVPSAHVGAPVDTPRPRAAQEVPPAVRRSVLRRDHHRCQVPGCQHATFVDVHHLLARADGGEHHPNNLLTLCAAHHRAVHEGTLVIAGSATERGLLVRHADGTLYGTLPAVPVALVQTRAFQALRGLGFTERSARQALNRALETLEPHAELEVVLRHALQLLTANATMEAS